MNMKKLLSILFSIINDKNVTLKGNDGKIMVAIWCQGAYTYAIDTPGISADVILKLIQQMG